MSIHDYNGANEAIMATSELERLPIDLNFFDQTSQNNAYNEPHAHPLYTNAKPQNDGMYHCPWEGQVGCSHKPDLLKSSYEYSPIPSQFTHEY